MRGLSCSSLILAVTCLRNLMISCWLWAGASRMSRMVWAEVWSWDSSRCRRTFSGSFTVCFSCLGSCLGSALLSACLALLPRLISRSGFDLLSPADFLFFTCGFSTLIERGSVACSINTVNIIP